VPQHAGAQAPPPILQRCLALAMLGCLLADCASRPADDPQSKSGGFYGGVGGGMGRP
jgi:hypothetical protein